MCYVCAYVRVLGDDGWPIENHDMPRDMVTIRK